MALLPADADLAKRDAAIPGLATLLDPDALVAALQSCLPDTELEGVTPTYVRYKPGMNCLVEYTLSAGGRETPAHAKAYGPDASIKLQKARSKPGVVGEPGIGKAVLDDLKTVVSFFPNDDKLKGLKHLANGEDCRKVLEKLFADRPELHREDLETLRYKPERRYVARLAPESETPAVLKFYTKSGYRAAWANATAFNGAFEASGPLRLTRLLGSSERYGVLALEWLSGVSLDEVLAAPEGRLDAVELVGVALAGLHAQSPEKLKPLTRQEEARSLLTVASGVGFTCPHLTEEVHELAGRISSRILHEPLTRSPVHGDFYDEQVLLSDGSVAILDLDRSVMGDPAIDLGNFVAHLERDALYGDLPEGLIAPLTEHLLEGYRSAAGHPVLERVRLYTAAGLLKLAPEPFRRRDHEWPERTAQLLARVRTLLRDTSRLRVAAS